MRPLPAAQDELLLWLAENGAPAAVKTWARRKPKQRDFAAEWETLADPRLMLDILSTVRDEQYPRALRLFAVASARDVAVHMPPVAIAALAAASSYLAGRGSFPEMQAAHKAARRWYTDSREATHDLAALWSCESAALCGQENIVWAAREIQRQVAYLRGMVACDFRSENGGYRGEHDIQLALEAGYLRDLFPNPFQP
jgi:hypothetical protein